MIDIKYNKQRRYSTQTYSTCILFVSAIFLVTVFSCCSWIYPINPWDDANVFMSIGKSMKHGMKLYLDVFDQKGPCLFLIHQLACYVSEHSFLGIYILEIFCLWGFLTFSYRIMRLYSDNAITLPLTLLIGLLYIASDFFWFGDSVEEFSLPILSYSLFHILKFLKTGCPPKAQQSLLIGIGIGLIFWMKFTILTFYAGALTGLVVVSYSRKQLDVLNKILLQILTGVLFVTIPVIIYFLYHDTLAEMLDAYFYTNIFLYHGSATNGEPAGMLFKLLKIALCAMLVIPVALIRVQRDIRLTVVPAFALQMLSYTLFTVHIYYFIPLFVFSPLTIYFLRKGKTTWMTYLCFAVLATVSTATNFNVITLLTGRFPNAVTDCAQVINSDTENNKKVLTFCSRDTGIYLLTDQLPPNRHFFVPNVKIPEIRTEQANTLARGDIKYLIRKKDINTNIIPYYETEVPQGYNLILHTKELYRYRVLINPLKYLWSLGYTQGLLAHIMTKNDWEYQTFYLYRKNSANNHQ